MGGQPEHSGQFGRGWPRLEAALRLTCRWRGVLEAELAEASLGGDCFPRKGAPPPRRTLSRPAASWLRSLASSLLGGTTGKRCGLVLPLMMRSWPLGTLRLPSTT